MAGGIGIVPINFAQNDIALITIHVLQIYLNEATFIF